MIISYFYIRNLSLPHICSKNREYWNNVAPNNYKLNLKNPMKKFATCQTSHSLSELCDYLLKQKTQNRLINRRPNSIPERSRLSTMKIINKFH